MIKKNDKNETVKVITRTVEVVETKATIESKLNGVNNQLATLNARKTQLEADLQEMEDFEISNKVN